MVPSASTSQQPTPDSKDEPHPSTSYLDTPSSSFRRLSRPSLDSTYTDLSELSFASTEIHQHQHRPLMKPASRDHPDFAQQPTTFRSRLLTKFHQLYVLNYGALLVMLAQFFGTLMNLSTRLLEHPGPHGEGMHPFQILFARQSITSLTCTIWALSTKRIPDFPLGPKSTTVRMLLLTRGLCGFLGVFGMYFSLLYLPLSEATVLTFLAPILTCYLCSWVMPGESFSRQQQFAGLVSLVGVVFIARPISFFASSNSQGRGDGSQAASNSTLPETAPTDATSPPTPQQHLIATAISLLGVIGGTGAMTSIRAIGNRAHPFLSINYFSVFCTLMSLVCLLVFKDVKFRLPGNWTEWGLLGSLGACGFVMQWLLTRGLSYGSGSPAKEVGGGKSRVGGEGKGGADEMQEDVELGEHHGGAGNNTSPKGKRKSYAEGKEAPIKGSGTRATSMVYTQMLFALAGDKLVFGVTPGTMSWIGSGLILAGAIWVASARDKDSNSQHGERGAGPGASEHAACSDQSRTGPPRRKGEETSLESDEETVGLMSAVGDLDNGKEQEEVELEEMGNLDNRTQRPG